MATKSIDRLPLIAIVGPTASGKTSLAIDLAEEFQGEIICADSRTIYKGMDIGTAKPTVSERHRTPHWGLDLVEPNERFSVVDFKHYAVEKIQEIRGRGHIPLLVGGTGLYVDAVIFDYQFMSKPNDVLRQKLTGFSIEELHEYCIHNNIKLPENKFNKRYVIRAIELEGAQTTRRQTPIENSYVVGIATDRDILRTRIEERSEQIFNNSVVDEATMLGNKYGWQSEAMTGNVYPLIRAYLEGDITQQQMKERFATLDWRLAKRQLTWLRRNPYVEWRDLKGAHDYIVGLLVNE